MIKMPMLAEPAGKIIRFPVLASPKLDGIRAVNVEGVLMSRKMKPIPNPFVQKTFGELKLAGLDGELMVGNNFQSAQAVMRKTGDVDVYWYVFDRWNHPAGFIERLKMVGTVWHPRIRIVPHTMIYSQEELDLYEAQRLADGFEGVMIRDPQGPYKQGRSTANEGWLLKVKRFLDSEAEIIGFDEEMHNTNPAETSETGHMKRSSRQEGLVGKNTLGALKVRDIKSGVEFSIGTGFTAAYRAIYWDQREKLIGEIVSYKYQPTGVKDRPRFPVFKGFRHKDDIGE